MRIAFVLDDSLDPPDGVQQYVLTLGRWLTGQGHYVAYITGRTRRDDIENVYGLGDFVTTRFNGNVVRTPKTVSSTVIRSALVEIRPDVIHVQMPYSPLFAAKVIKNAAPGTAVVGTFHVLPTSSAGRLANRALGLALKPTLARFDAICAVSEAALQFASYAYGIKANLVPNLIDVQRFVGPHRHSRGKVRIVFLGRLVPRKGLLQLIKAFNALPDEVAEKAQLMIGGKGPLAARAAGLIQANRDIRLLGFVSETDKAEFLGDANIAVFPSVSGESFGIILLEAMAAGAEAVLAGDNPGYRGVMEPTPDALFDPNDTVALTRRLAFLISDQAARKRLGQLQTQIAHEHDVSAIGPRLLGMYEGAIEGRRSIVPARA